MNKQRLILASSSPRRRELLQQANIPFSLRKQHADESTITETDPATLVKELAQLKGRAVPIEHECEVILSADTVVAFNGKVLGKPKSKAEAFNVLKQLSGNTHDVYTGVLLRSKHSQDIIVERTEVTFWSLSDDEISAYIESGDPFDKAGAYGIQSGGAIFVKGIKGDYYSVVGLPLSRVVRSLRKFAIFPST